MDFAKKCGFERHELADIALAVGEACNNAAEHGHVAGGFFTLNGSCRNDVLTIEVHDGGHGFELSGKGLSTDPQQRGVRGLGIFIMRAIMDDVSYRMDCGGTTVVLTKRRRASVADKAEGNTPASAESYEPIRRMA
jgi:anti-sigma regulatory factor (Ser/Thr protein kinase)